MNKRIIKFMTLRLAIIVGFVMLYGNFIYAGEMIICKEPVRPKGQTDVLLLKCDPIPVVWVGFIGIGMRGVNAVK